MSDRELIADLLSALEYHTEQTRPIHSTSTAIDAAREYLRTPQQVTAEPVATLKVFAETGSTWHLDRQCVLPPGEYALYASPPPAQRQPQWQPIETAPRDGTTILLTAPGRVTAGEWHAEQWPTASEHHSSTGEYLGQYETGECIPAAWYSWDGGFTEEHAPTHWMPLSAPPEQGEQP